MSFYEELSQTFPEEETPFGVCLLIPNNLYNKEMDERLKAEGCKVFQQAYNGRLFLFVKKSEANSEQAQPKRYVWTSEELKLLSEMRMQGLTPKEIASKLGKPVGSVLGKLRGLKQKAEENKTVMLNCEPADLFREFADAVLQLYPAHKRVCSFLLREMARMLEGKHSLSTA